MRRVERGGGKCEGKCEEGGEESEGEESEGELREIESVAMLSLVSSRMTSSQQPLSCQHQLSSPGHNATAMQSQYLRMGCYTHLRRGTNSHHPPTVPNVGGSIQHYRSGEDHSEGRLGSLLVGRSRGIQRKTAYFRTDGPSIHDTHDLRYPAPSQYAPSHFPPRSWGMGCGGGPGVCGFVDHVCGVV